MAHLLDSHTMMSASNAGQKIAHVVAPRRKSLWRSLKFRKAPFPKMEESRLHSHSSSSQLRVKGKPSTFVITTISSKVFTMKKIAPQPSRKADSAAARTKTAATKTDAKAAKGVGSSGGRNTKPDRPQGLSRLERAQKKLNGAAEKLKMKIPPDMLLQDDRLKTDSVQGCADVNCIAEHMGLAIENVMYERSREDVSEKESVRELVKRLVKKTSPLLEQGLAAAKVLRGFLTFTHFRVQYPSPSD